MKKGISLIVLVITIIVMIILASSVVLSLSNSNIIEKANQAVKLTDERQIQDIATLAWTDAYLDTTRTDTIEKVVKDALAAQGITDADWNITVTDNGVSVSKKAATSGGLISFSIEGITYQAEEGMTWREWVNSEYNTDDYYSIGFDVYYLANDNLEYPIDEIDARNPIDANHAYSLSIYGNVPGI